MPKPPPLHQDSRFTWVMAQVPRGQGQIVELRWPALGVVWVILEDGTRFVSKDIGESWYEPGFWQWQWIRFFLFLHVWLPITIFKIEREFMKLGKNEFILGIIIVIVGLSFYISEIADTLQETLVGFLLVMVAIVLALFAMLFPSNAKLHQGNDEDE